jgi:ComF family protein
MHIALPVCERCGLPLAPKRSCPACRAHNFAFTASRAWGVYQSQLRQAILSLKRRRNAALGSDLAKGLWELFQPLDWQVDLLIPVPLGSQRLRQRGYNQVELLARPFASLAGLQYAESVLIRRHDTLPQFELNAAERWENLHASFVAKPEPLRGLTVLVVDDIMTSGATLDAAAHALREAGVEQVFAITLARALATDERAVYGNH